MTIQIILMFVFILVLIFIFNNNSFYRNIDFNYKIIIVNNNNYTLIHINDKQNNIKQIYKIYKNKFVFNS